MRYRANADDWRPTEGAPWRKRVFDIIFLHDTPLGRAFDIGLIAAIVLSVAIVMLDSVEGFAGPRRTAFRTAEWIFTILFTVEYLLRLATVRVPRAYAQSFFGIVDLLAVIPTYLSLLIPGGQYLIAIRILRVLRVFRVLKLAQYMGEARTLGAALRASRYKITVFLFTVLTIVIVVGSLMFIIEGPVHGFTSIPKGVYWAIVTLTTVGYGDISPGTAPGQLLAALVMIMGYGIIAVPTGIVTVELANQARQLAAVVRCRGCGVTDHAPDAAYCRKCGEPLERHRHRRDD